MNARFLVRRQLDAGARGITVPILKKAEQFFAAGILDILYAVGIVPVKPPHALTLRSKGCDLKIITDSISSAQAIVRFGKPQGESLEVWIEVDVDRHRSGVAPEVSSAPRRFASRLRQVGPACRPNSPTA